MGRATLFEEHASVLPHWVGNGLRDATVVCLDAHLDLHYIAPDRIARLQACRTPAEMRKLESPHPLSPCRDFCYGSETSSMPRRGWASCGGWCGLRRRTCCWTWTRRCVRCARWRA